jgi:tRNA A-37 threonylcarbamoyl transferase component Bud32
VERGARLAALRDGRRVNPDRWQQVESLFHEALAREADARAAWLDEACGGDADLRAQVESLLAAAGRSDALLERNAVEEWAPLLADGEQPESPAESPPEGIGPYRILGELGRGGMGRVYLAEEETEEFRRRVALKVIQRPAFDDAAVRRFRDEVRILASLEHPGIARFFDGGRAADGTWFLALEYVQGEDLLRYVRGRDLDVRGRVELFLQVLEAVEFAHRRLVVHRDLKPGNVLVDADGRARLLDFGISKILDPDRPEVTRTELRAFTPAYASPEQLRGEPVTTAADVYSLGVMLYELLAGRRPFGRREVEGADLVEVSRALLEHDPQPPSTAVRETRTSAEHGDTKTMVPWRELAGDLDAIILKALRAAPESRYPSVAALAEDLRRWLAGKPVEARRGGRRYRLGKFVRRHRLPVGFAALAVVALVAGTVIAVAQARASARERDRALEDLRRAEVTNDFSVFLLSAADSGGGRPGARADLLARGEETIERRLASDAGLRLHLLLMLAERYYENTQYESWKRVAERAYQLSRRSDEHRLRALASCLMAAVESELGDDEKGSSFVAEGLAELAAEPGALAEEARCRIAEARVAATREDGIRAAERAMALERQRRGPPGRELEALNAVAMMYYLGGRYAEADRAFAELMRLFAAQGRDRTQSAAICANNWALSAHSAGQMLRAAELSRRAVELAREIDPDKGAPPHVLATFAWGLSNIGRHEEALAVVDEAVVASRATATEHSRAIWYALNMATRLAADAGRLDLAAARFAEFKEEVRRQGKSGQYWHELITELLGARMALAGGKPDEAAALARSALERIEKESGKATEDREVLSFVASALNAAGDFADARPLAERAVASAAAKLGGFEHSYHLGQATLELGLAQAALGARAAAVETLRSAAAHLRATAGEDAPETRRAAASLQRLGG